MIDDYARAPFQQQYPSNSQLSLQPAYSSRQSITDNNYGQKHISVRNKYCDIYGQIHDAPQTGIVMGRLQNSQTPTDTLFLTWHIFPKPADIIPKTIAC
jgi:hypothetical protein